MMHELFVLHGFVTLSFIQLPWFYILFWKHLDSLCKKLDASHFERENKMFVIHVSALGHLSGTYLCLSDAVLLEQACKLMFSLYGMVVVFWTNRQCHTHSFSFLAEQCYLLHPAMLLLFRPKTTTYSRMFYM